MDKDCKNTKRMNVFQRILDLYIDGFRNMTIGRTLWALIIIKLFIIFIIIKLLFFPDLLETNFSNDEQRAQHVRNELLRDR